MPIDKPQWFTNLLKCFQSIPDSGAESKKISHDYILVAKRDPKKNDTQEEFLNCLREKKLEVKKIEGDDDQKLFFGIKAQKDIFDKYSYLLKVSDTCNCTPDANPPSDSTRIRIVHFILHHTKTTSGKNLHDLIGDEVFEEKFCLHEKEKQKELTEHWAQWKIFYKVQPINLIRSYFGEKVALYFMWLGWYTYQLSVPAVIGILVFLYNLSHFNSSPLINEVCASQTIMCPRCDKGCKVWTLSETCTYAKLNLLVDNYGTVGFAMFVAIWTTLFLEYWRRHRASFICKWKVDEWSEEEEELILGIVNDPKDKPKIIKHSYLCSTVVLICFTLMILLIIGLTNVLVVIRVVVGGLLDQSSIEFLSKNSSTGAMLAGAFLHFLIITIMKSVNKRVAFWLCKIKKTRTFAELQKSFTVKMFALQFFTYFCSLFYVAFILGRINGHPGNYKRFANKWRLEECHPSGCLMDLFIQMTVIMVLKQILSSVFQYIGPWFHKFIGRKRSKNMKSCDLELNDVEEKDQMKEPNCELDDCLDNYRLTNVDSFTLFDEFLEMVIQFSFTTIFVAAFPLAPLFALLNNVVEIRLDAIKMVTLERRMVPKRTNNIGVWVDILESIGTLAVIVNGLVIGISSNFIDRLVYQYIYGPCSKSSSTDIDCMVGYIKNTLSTASMNDSRVNFNPAQMLTDEGLNATHCRFFFPMVWSYSVFSLCSYKDYRDNEFELTQQFWLILAARFAFVILFQHVLLICKFIAAWLVPSCPMHIKNERLEEKFQRLIKELNSFEDSQNGK